VVLTDRPTAVARARALLDRPALGIALVLLPFLALTLWWIAADSRVPDFDSGRSLQNALAMRDALGRGDLLAPITQDNFNHYPPLLYLVASLGLAIGGDSIDSMRLAHILVFMPLLALGVWGTARRAYGQRAGLLAAVFALGTPIVVSLFHAFMLDVAQTALVAVCVWLVLESRRFERVGIAALAGLAGGGAMLLKPTTAIFLSGFVVVVLARGGWRNWRGLLGFLAVGAVLSVPWYVEHYTQLRGLTAGAATDTTGGGASSYLTPPRTSFTNVIWYGWDLLNVELLAPLFAAFVVGAVVAAVRFARTRRSDDPTPELLIGGLVSYVGITWIILKDPRYTLPALVYVATLGVAWLPALRGIPRRLAAGAVVAFAAANTIMISFGLGQTVQLAFTQRPATMLGERTIRILSPNGFVVGEPRDDSDVLRVMRAVKADGIDTMELDPGGDASFSVSGLQVLLRFAGLRQPPVYRANALDPDTAFLLRHPVPPQGPQPCGRISAGQGVYLIRGGNAVVPFEDYKLYCPPRR
jgi:4-amino-4-deoxy-L-arabinose transferase-like glycosyltransferase